MKEAKRLIFHLPASTRYGVGSKVKIKPIERRGKITGLFLGERGFVEYRTRYFDEADEKSAYFEEDELEDDE